MAVSAKDRYAKYITTPRGRACALIRGAQARCLTKGMQCTVTAEQVASVIEAGHCQLTGLAFDMHPLKGKMYNPYAPSIDRIDPDNYNYTPDNVRIVLAWINIALNQHGLEASMPIVRALSGV